MRLFIFVLLILPSVLRADGLTFSKPLMELTAAVDAKTITADYEFTNNTGKTVTILRHESECSCMTIEPVGKKLQYDPGETGILRATFEKGRSTGTVEKNIKLWLTDDPADKPSSLLKLRVQIPDLVELRTKTVNWKIGAPGDEITVKITINGDKPVKITGITCSDPNFTHTLATVQDGKSYELKIRCSSTATRAMGIFKIETDSTDEGQRIAQVFGVVR